MPSGRRGWNGWVHVEAVVRRQIRLATGHEIRQREFFWAAATLRMQHPNRRFSAGKWIDQLDLPHPLAPISAVLLQHARPGRSQSLRKCLTERVCRAVEVSVGPPSEVLRAIQYFLHAHFEDRVGVCAHPRTARRDVAQQRVEHNACLPLMQRIDPNQHTIHRHELIAYFIREFLIENCRLRVNTDRAEFLKHAMKAVVLRRGRAPCLVVAAPKHRYSTRFACHRLSHSFDRTPWILVP